jgi:hypothetical protein
MLVGLGGLFYHFEVSSTGSFPERYQRSHTSGAPDKVLRNDSATDLHGPSQRAGYRSVVGNN